MGETKTPPFSVAKTQIQFVIFGDSRTPKTNHENPWDVFRTYYCKRFAQSAGPGFEKNPLLELIFAWLRKGSTFGAHFRTRGVLLCNFWLIFRSLGALWERWGATF